MSFGIPPGIAYILSLLPGLVSPPLAVYLLSFIARTYLEVSLPTWACLLSFLLSVPIALTVKVQYKDYINRRDAAALGAVLPPEIPASYGGISTVLEAVRDLATGYPGELLGSRCEEMGNTYGIQIGGKNRVFTAEPEYIKAMLSTQFSSFEKGAAFRSVFHSLLGSGVFGSDGTYNVEARSAFPLSTPHSFPSRFHREMTRPFFAKDRISDFDIFDSHVEDAITQIRNRLKEGFPVDFQEMMSRVTLDCTSTFLFGHDVRSLSTPLPYPFHVPQSQDTSTDLTLYNSFGRAFAEAQALTAVRIRYVSHWPLTEFWKDKIKDCMSVVHGFLDPILKEAIAKKRGARGFHSEVNHGKFQREVQEGETLLGHLVNYTEDHTILRDEMLNINVAGRDTTASLLTFTAYMLAEHPEVLSKLRAEILNRVGPTERPTHEDIKEMKYLRAVLNETLRLYPPVPLNFRTSTKPVVWPSVRGSKPIYIPPDTLVPYGPIMMHRRKDLWGPDALEYDPERFIDSRLQKYLLPNPYIFLPFNGGPRICLGQQFAYQEASFIVVRLLQTFSKISLAPTAQPPESRVPDHWAQEDAMGWKRREKIRPKADLSLYVMGGLWLTMEEADGL
ncbi:cytochrome P450 [Mycena sp. CBHHK59/15]|nr:cytochrome P450 [Mycena sp. CBHHK59/15]